MKRATGLILIIYLTVLYSCSREDEEPDIAPFQLNTITIGGAVNAPPYLDIDPDFRATLNFTDNIDQSTVQKNITLKSKSGVEVTLAFQIQGNDIIIQSTKPLNPYATYQLIINTGLKSAQGQNITMGKVIEISTGVSPTDKYPRITDEELLTQVQKQTFKYFWDFGHPVSGMARERSTSGDIVTTGGTGFGVMSIIVGVERKFISRTEAIDRLLKITRFLKNNATTYHGAYSHWINGTTGSTVPFSVKDNGADLVETSLLLQGLLTVRQYFTNETPGEIELRTNITELWKKIEWSWYRRNNQNVLYWHWSPEYQWEMNHKITGWNECLITYLLAASSPTYPIDKNTYDEGWAVNGQIKNGNNYFSYPLPLGPAYGGPLFFAHYSFLGLNPTNLTDKYANYWLQNENHSKINNAYCALNPEKKAGYSNICWGLTASDGNEGYSAYSPTNDKGVIAPTASLSSMPYTPEESMAALHFFYYKLGDKLWKEYGFIDSFNFTEQWYASDFIAINQGPIIIMIENYRTQLLWNLFMEIPEIKNGLSKLEFNY